MLSLPPPPPIRRAWLLQLSACLLVLCSVAPVAFAQAMPPEGAAADRAFDTEQFAEARRLYRVDCDARRDGHSCQRLGLLLVQGLGGAEDIAGARHYARLACDAGNGRGCNQIGLMTREGRGGAPNPAEAARYLDRGCELGWGYSCFVRASAYWDDEATRDDARSRPYFDRACRLGTHDACYFIGFLADWGKGGPADEARARAAYTQACEQAQTERWESCSALATLLEEGRGGAVALPQARRRYAMACDNGVLFACNNLAVMEAIGQGGPVDRAAAYRRLDRACAAGDAKNCETARVFRRIEQESRLAAQPADRRTDEEFRNDPRMWQEPSQRRGGSRAASGSGQGVSWARQQMQSRTPQVKTCRWKTYEGYGGGRVCVQE